MTGEQAVRPTLGEGLVGRGVLVTGAAGGIGAAVARAFAASGARVAAVDLSEQAVSDLAASFPGEATAASPPTSGRSIGFRTSCARPRRR